MEVLVPRSAQSVPQYANLRVRTVGTMSGTCWEQLDLPRYCRGELLLTLSGGAPILHSRNVITIHDAAVFAASGAYSPAYRLWYQQLYRRMARKAERISQPPIFPSRKFVKWCAAPPEKISVTYLGSEHFSNLETDASALPRFGISGRYVLLSAPRIRTRTSSARPRPSSASKKGIGVVIAGGSDPRIFQRSLDLPTGVRVLGYVSDAELKALYQNAACFVFASLYEGFGLAPLEAISSGCPVVVARAASYRNSSRACRRFLRSLSARKTLPQPLNKYSNLHLQPQMR